jgi:hypothetical protein
LGAGGWVGAGTGVLVGAGWVGGGAGGLVGSAGWVAAAAGALAAGVAARIGCAQSQAQRIVATSANPMKMSRWRAAPMYCQGPGECATRGPSSLPSQPLTSRGGLSAHFSRSE